MAEGLEKYATALRLAANQLRELQSQNEKLASENEALTLQLIAKERAARSVKLANEMYSKGLIKKAEIDDEVDRLMEMDDKAFEMVKSAIARISIEKNTAGLDTISGLIGGDYEEGASGKRSSLAQSIIDG